MLNLVNDIRPISYIKSHTAEMIRQVEEKKNPIVITQNGEAKAILMDVSSYQNLMDAVNLMKIISIGENDIRNGRIISHEEAKNRFKKVFD
jgi:prevent-host-death family protein